MATMIVTLAALHKYGIGVQLYMGVKKGRKWVDRIVFYFAMIFLVQ
ncbi:MAG: hypothetical protein ACLUKN_06870 [Bacilli bacterium]